MIINAKDNINTRKCYRIDYIDTVSDFNEDGTPHRHYDIHVKNIDFMKLKDGDAFILHEADGTLITWHDGSKMISIAKNKPYYKIVNGLRIKSIDTESDYTEHKYLMYDKYTTINSFIKED